MRAARAVTTLSRAQADRLREVFPGLSVPVRVIPHAVDVTGPRDPGFRAAHGIDAAAPVVLHVAGIRPEKGFPEAWDIADALRAAVPGLRYVHAGPVLAPDLGPAADAWFSTRPWAVRLGGPPREVVLDATAAATCTLHASTVEGLSNALLESMALGVPPVARDIAASRELVTDGVDGLLFTDADRAVQAVRRLCGDGGLRSALGDAGRRTARERYSLAAERDAYVAVYRTATR